MRQSKNHTIIFIILIILSILLSIPKTYQLDALLGPLLDFEEMSFFLSHRSFFILLGLFLEFMGTALSIVIIKYVYHFAKINLSLIQNANIYLFISCLIKVITLILPIMITSKLPFLNNLLFSILFVAIHHLLNKEYSKKQWIYLSAYPLVNLLLGFL